MDRLRENRLRSSPSPRLERNVLVFDGGVRSIEASVEKPDLVGDVLDIDPARAGIACAEVA